MEKIKCLIVGGGPAGYTAAVYASRADISPVVYEGVQPGGQLTTTTDIENYPGFENGIAGPELMATMRAQAVRLGADIRNGAVTSADLSQRPFRIVVDGTHEIEAETLIIATGATAKYLGLPSETKFKGLGVSACATCDGFLYKGKTIGVLCTTKDLEHEVHYLASLAEKMYLMPLYKDVQVTEENVEIIMAKPKAITGGMKAQQVEFVDRTVDIDGVFMLKQAVTPSVLLYGLECQDGHITIDRGGRTNLPGCFAAGDCTGRPYQYVKAAGEGNVAAHSAAEYLAQTK